MDKKNNYWRRPAIVVSGIAILLLAITTIGVSIFTKDTNASEKDAFVSAGADFNTDFDIGVYGQQDDLQLVDLQTQAKNISFVDQKNKEVELRDFINDKPIVLHFWVTWCKYCQLEFPEMIPVYEAYKDKVTFLMVSIAEKRKVIEKFMTDNDYTFPYLIDTDGKGANTYGVRGTPTTFFITSDGTIVKNSPGLIHWIDPKIEERILLDKMVEDNLKKKR